MKTQAKSIQLQNKTQQLLIMLAVAGMISGATFTSTAFVSAANHNEADSALIDQQSLELMIEGQDDVAVTLDDNEPIHYGEDDDRPASDRANESGLVDIEVTAQEAVATNAAVPAEADPLSAVLDNVVVAVNTIQGDLDAGSMTEEEATALLENLVALVAMVAQMSSN